MFQAENILFTAAMAGYFGTMILYFCFAALRKEQPASAGSPRDWICHRLTGNWTASPKG